MHRRWLIYLCLVLILTIIGFGVFYIMVYADEKTDLQAQIKYIEQKITDLQGQMREKALQIQMLVADKDALQKRVGEIDMADRKKMEAPK